jgi:hypothetical protein
MSKPVYVLTVTYHNPQGSPVIIPEVFDSLDGAKEFVKENWGVEFDRISPSKWIANEPEFVVRINKRNIFKR